MLGLGWHARPEGGGGIGFAEEDPRQVAVGHEGGQDGRVGTGARDLVLRGDADVAQGARSLANA